MTRQKIVVDVETNGLNIDRHQAFEVSWFNLDTGEHATFIPPHDASKLLATADIESLKINRYIDRIPGRATESEAMRQLHRELQDNTLVGSNPAFDAAFLTKLFKAKTAGDPTPWHHRLWDVSAYAAGVLRLKELPGLYKLCELLNIDLPDHTAEGDVMATVACMRKLEEIAARVPWEEAA